MSKIESKLREMEIRFDEEECVVIDNGTGFIKAGFSGQDLPRIVMPTCIGEKTEIIDTGITVSTAMHEATTEKKSYAFGNSALS
jgi:actin-related protein